jgi:hypothetical protein
MNFRSLVLELAGLLFSMILWFIAMEKFFDAISKGMDWRVALTLIGLGLAGGASAITLIYKGQIDTVKERLSKKDDHIKFLEQRYSLGRSDREQRNREIQRPVVGRNGDFASPPFDQRPNVHGRLPARGKAREN